MNGFELVSISLLLAMKFCFFKNQVLKDFDDVVSPSQEHSVSKYMRISLHLLFLQVEMMHLWWKNPEITQAQNGIPDTSVDSALITNRDTGFDKWPSTRLS